MTVTRQPNGSPKETPCRFDESGPPGVDDTWTKSVSERSRQPEPCEHAVLEAGYGPHLVACEREDDEEIASRRRSGSFVALGVPRGLRGQAALVRFRGNPRFVAMASDVRR